MHFPNITLKLFIITYVSLIEGPVKMIIRKTYAKEEKKKITLTFIGN